MKLDQATAVLRPRSAWEAVDLGCAIVRRHWGPLMAGWLAVALPLWTLIVLLLRDHPGLAFGALLLTKPVLTRQPVFFLSRALFGKPPRIREYFRDWKLSLWKGLLSSLTLRRFSMQRAFRLPVIMLEGQRGRGYSQRVNVLSSHGGGNATALHFTSLLLQLVIAVGLFEYGGDLFLEEGYASRGLTLELMAGTAPDWLIWTWNALYALSVTITEPFYAGAGFALYINTRTHLEGWDIEVAFRRMSLRLAPPVAVAVLVLMAGLLVPGKTHAAQTARDPKTEVQEILKGPDFELDKYKVRKEGKKASKPNEGKAPEKERSAKTSTESGTGSSGGGAGFHWIGYIIIGAAVCVIAWLLWQNRKSLRRSAVGRTVTAGPRVVMGMDIAPESLPDDIPQIAWREFQAGRAAEALRLLYRGALAWFVDRASLPVHESDTEGDCLRHAHKLTDTARISFFESLTAAWVNCAYADEPPPPGPMKHLCEQWPFSLMQRRSRFPGGAAALLILALTATLFAGCKRGDPEPTSGDYEEKVRGYKGPAAVNPWLAATRLLDRLSIKVETKRSLRGMPAYDTAVFVSADIIGSRGAAKEALAWAGRGGHLIVACSGTDRFRNDWRESDLFDFENNDKPVKDAAAPVFKELNVSFAETTPSKVTEVSFEDGETATLECGNPAGLKLGRWHPDVLAGENDSAALASFSYKSGRVTLLATAEPFRNRYIDHADNASVLYELLQLHHSRSLLLILGGRTTLWGMLVEYAWMPLTATVLLVILWLWRHLPRFGRALPADQSSVRHFGTQLDEAGMFLSERAGHHALLAAARRAVHQAAAQRGVHEQGQGLAENLSARAGIPVAAVSEALNTSNDPGDPVAAAITLQKLQQSLGVTL